MSNSTASRGGLGLPSFFAMVGLVMGALKLKDGYQRVSDEEGRTAPGSSHSPPRYHDEEGEGLLYTEIQTSVPRKRSRGCCVCWGLNCSLFWKAFGVVVGGFAIYHFLRFAFWAATPMKTELEDMPAYGSSLSCGSAPYILDGGAKWIKVPMGKRQDHAFDVRGSGVGTFVIAEAREGDATEIEYKIEVRSDNKELLEHVSVQASEADEEGTALNSMLVVSTPRVEEAEGCTRFEITMYVPRGLKKLHVAAHALAHVRFDGESELDLDDLHVTLYAAKKENLLLPHEKVRANKLSLEIFRGWMVGDVSVLNHTSITTQRGDGVANVRLHPTATEDFEAAEPAWLQTTTGAGRTEMFYVENAGGVHRPIRGVHMSSRNGDVYLHYEDSIYNGKLELDTKSYTLDAPRFDRQAGWVGDRDGPDKIFVKSRGWVGLYF